MTIGTSNGYTSNEPSTSSEAQGIPPRKKFAQFHDPDGNAVFVTHTRRTKKGIKETKTPLLYDPYISKNRQKLYPKQITFDTSAI